jgi:hypothetical protein
MTEKELKTKFYLGLIFGKTPILHDLFYRKNEG